MEAPKKALHEKVEGPDTENEARVKRLDEAAKEAAEHEREGLVLDFDEALTEFRKRKKKVEVRLLGQTFHLPSSTPADFATFYLRHCLTKVEGGWTFSIPEDKYLEFMEFMFGEDPAQIIMGSKLEIEFVIKKVVPRVLIAWGLEFIKLEEDTEGKAEAVEATPDSSSGDGSP